MPVKIMRRKIAIPYHGADSAGNCRPHRIHGFLLESGWLRLPALPASSPKAGSIDRVGQRVVPRRLPVCDIIDPPAIEMGIVVRDAAIWELDSEIDA